MHEAQQTVASTALRFNVLNCGVRWGKTTMCTHLVYAPMRHGFPTAWYAPTYKVLEEVWRTLRSLFRSVATRVSDAGHRIEVPGGGVLEMWSLDDPDASMGRRYKRIVVDEASAVKKLQYSWETVLRARLMDFQGDAFFPSTPRGYNYFKTLYDNEARGMNGWRSWTFPTWTNPYIKPEEIEEARRLLPERTFREMYGAEFVPGGRFFAGVEDACTVLEPEDPKDHAGHSQVIGVDWGQSVDWTVLTCMCRECSRVVDWQRFNQIGYGLQRDRLKAMARKWNVVAVLPERNSIGQPNIEELLKDGVPIALGPDGKPGFNTTASTKALIVERLGLALGNGTIKVPKDYQEELLAFEQEPRDGAPARYSHPDGGHDDRVISLALANYVGGNRLQLWI